LSKNVAGTITQAVVTDVGMAQVNSIQVVTSGTSIVATGYSGTNFTGSTGTISTTQTAGGTSHGIIAIPGASYTNNAIDDFSAQ
jgi:hypothetical protein